MDKKQENALRSKINALGLIVQELKSQGYKYVARELKLTYKRAAKTLLPPVIQPTKETPNKPESLGST